MSEEAATWSQQAAELRRRLFEGEAAASDQRLTAVAPSSMRSELLAAQEALKQECARAVHRQAADCERLVSQLQERAQHFEHSENTMARTRDQRDLASASEIDAQRRELKKKESTTKNFIFGKIRLQLKTRKINKYYTV